jgi:hypothetical protein
VAMDNTIDLTKATYFDIHSSTEQVIFGNDFSGGKGEDLQTALEEYMELLMSLSGSGLDKAIKEMLDTGSQGKDQESWLGYNFYHTPMISALNILSNYQLKIRYLEGEILREL